MNITVIIPIHEYDETIGGFFNTAIETIAKQDYIEERPEVIVVYAASLESNEDFMNQSKEAYENLTISYLKNEGETDFQSQINLAVDSVKTKYFTFLEFDDEYSTSFFHQAIRHTERLPKVDLFLPIMVEVNTDSKGIKLTNETVWSRQFIGENGTVGYLNLTALNQYTDFKIGGGIFNTESFIAVGKLKPNIKLTSTYELLLRMLNNGDVIFTIPKIGYKHLADRKGALFTTYGDELDPNYIGVAERKFWFDTAKKECNFFKDREIDLTPIQ